MARCGFSVSGGAALALAAAYFFGAERLLLLVVTAVLAHELGHFIALRLFGYNVTRVRLELTGVAMWYSGSLPYTRELVTAAAGPAASGALAVISAFYARQTQCEPAYQLAGLSLIFCLFNLLPVMPLDGGRILRALAARLFGVAAAERVSCAVSCAVIFALLTAGALLFAESRKNFTLLAAAAWLLFFYCKNGNNALLERRSSEQE